jgi:hypothetical protein
MMNSALDRNLGIATKMSTHKSPKPSSFKLSTPPGGSRWKCDRCGKGFSADSISKKELELIAGQMVCNECSKSKFASVRAKPAQWPWKTLIACACGLIALLIVFPQPGFVLLALLALASLLTGALASEMQFKWRMTFFSTGLIFGVLSIFGMFGSSKNLAETERIRLVEAACDDMRKAIANKDLAKAQLRWDVIQRSAVNPLGEYYSPQARQLAESAGKTLEEAILKDCPATSAEERAIWLHVIRLYPEKNNEGALRIQAVKLLPDRLEITLNTDNGRDNIRNMDSNHIQDVLALEARGMIPDLFQVFNRTDCISLCFMNGRTKFEFKVSRKDLASQSARQSESTVDFKQFLVR